MEEQLNYMEVYLYSRWVGPKVKVGGARFRKLFTLIIYLEIILNKHFTSTQKH